MPKHFSRILLALLPGLSSTIASAASFDCKLAHDKVETLICADEGVSKLDEQLEAVYAPFRKTSHHESLEKPTQLAWIKIRNSCADLACVRHAYESRISELRARSISASPIVGFWKTEYACGPAPGVYAEQCRQGGHDVFQLRSRSTLIMSASSSRKPPRTGDRDRPRGPLRLPGQSKIRPCEQRHVQRDRCTP
jgi:uncharacterized protein YecT (DUF1311 family)